MFRSHETGEQTTTERMSEGRGRCGRWEGGKVKGGRGGDANAYGQVLADGQARIVCPQMEDPAKNGTACIGTKKQ